LCPLESRQNALSASPQDAQDPQKKVTETEDLQATSLAFILGVRGAGQRTDPKDNTTVLSKSSSIRGRKVLGEDNRTIYAGQSIAFYSAAMPGTAGPMQYHQLGSLEFVRAYFANVLSSEVVPLSLSQVGAHRNINDRARSSGRIGAFEIARRRATDYGLNAVTGGRPEQPPERSTLTRMQDVARQLSFSGADARQIAANGGFARSPRLQGIFYCSLGPFLRGKGTTSGAVFGTPNNQPHMPMGATPDDPDMKLESAMQPFTMSRNAGDELAFGYLDALMLEHGLKDWVPDGVCLSKGQDDPSDKLSDEYLKARDAQLFNVRIAGPAVCSAFSGDPALELPTLGVCYVAIIADVWFSVTDVPELEVKDERGTRKIAPSTVLGTGVAASGESAAARDDRLAGAAIKTKELHADYQRLRERALGESLDLEAFRDMQARAFDDSDRADATEVVMTNFRVVLTNSEQMALHSQFKEGAQAGSALGLGERKALANASRLGLRLSNQMGEYVIGAHRIGNVLDTKASRGAMPTGNIGNVRTAPGSAAINLNVGISWETANCLFRKYDNTEGMLAHRYQPTKPDTERGPFTNPAVQTHVEYAEMALTDAQRRGEKVSLDLAAAKKKREATVAAMPGAEDVQRQRLEQVGEAKLRRDQAEAAATANPSDPALVKARTKAQEAHAAATSAVQAAYATVASLNATLTALNEEIPKLTAKMQRRSDFVAERDSAYKIAQRQANEAGDNRIDELRAGGGARDADGEEDFPPL